MNRLFSRFFGYCALLLFFTAIPALAEIHLPKLVSDGMVLQRDTKIKIWGWADPGEKISLSFLGKTNRTIADAQGNWIIFLKDLKAGGPFVMEISGKNTIQLKNILIGDVWLCSGQSNMELPMKRVAPLYETEIATAVFPEIRYFDVPKTYNFQHPNKDVKAGNWLSVTPKTVLNLSATAFFFAKEIYQQYKVPVGVIISALGGSPVQAWISEDSLKRFPDLYNEMQTYKNDDYIKQIESSDKNRISQWYSLIARKDAGYHSTSASWRNENTDTSDWKSITLPDFWPQDNNRLVNGIMWFRKNFQLSAIPKDSMVKLWLGRIVDADSVFINGHFAGTTSYQYPPRRYEFPTSYLQKGTNTLVVKVINSQGRGGFIKDKPYCLFLPGLTMDLTGHWLYKCGTTAPALEPETFIRWKAGGLYNAMIAPLVNYQIKGFLWYQGESNCDYPENYDKWFTTLIRDWRNRWKKNDLPFLFVQLPNYLESRKEPSESNWALLRESQTKALALPQTGMAVTIDLGEWNDIHPLNKKDVGFRLSLLAKTLAYHTALPEYSGPLFQSYRMINNQVELTFSHTGTGLIAKRDSLKGFDIAGKDGRFVKALSYIKNNHVVVYHPNVPSPVYVRYAWADNPSEADLYNREGLPASPFRVTVTSVNQN